MNRIVIYASTYLPTSETFIYNQLNSFSWFRPTMLCRSRANAKRFPNLSFSVAMTPEWLSSHLWLVPARFRERTDSYLHNLYALKCLLLLRPYVLLAHFGPAGMDVRRLAKLTGTPLVVMFHGYDATAELWARSFESRYPGLIGNAQMFLSVSSFITQRLVESGVPADMVRTHYLGIPVQGRPLPHAFSGTILQVGRLTEKKGHASSLRAFALAVEATGPLSLRIAGSGPLQSTLESLARELNISHLVEFLGDLTPSEIDMEMSNVDIFIHPSVTAANGDSEGLPIGILEAMAHSLPVVATRHGGIPEALDDSCGRLVDEHDHAALAQAIVDLVRSDALRRALGDAARERVEQDFNMQKQTAELELFLRTRG